jgi:hypothetical protein
MTGTADEGPLPPLLVAEGWDLTFFRSAESLAGYIESWFPPDVEYRAWDGVGRWLELVVVETPRSRGLRRLRDPGGYVILACARAIRMVGRSCAPTSGNGCTESGHRRLPKRVSR